VEVALTREVPRSIVRCELTHRARAPIDHARAVAQHRAYCQALEALGLRVLRLPADEAFPDCCFVEDAAVVLDEVAVLAMPGAVSRRGEVVAVEEALRTYRPLERIALPATLDGGDVLRIGRRLWVGRSSRTNEAGIEVLAAAVAPFGYEAVGMDFRGCLHLKSAVTALDEETVLVNPDWVEAGPLGCRMVSVAPGEPEAANVLRVGGELWGHVRHSRTLDLLESRGYQVRRLDVSEFVKAEAGLTCKSLLFRAG
jgi:dimethylargininase